MISTQQTAPLTSHLPNQPQTPICGRPIWKAMQAEASEASRKEPLLAERLSRLVLEHKDIESALSQLLSETLFPEKEDEFRRDVDRLMVSDESLGTAALCDLWAIRKHDPATSNYLTPYLHFKGFQALQSHRVAYRLWHEGRKLLARAIQSRVSEQWGVDIHPAATIGSAVFIDHATSVVIGETAKLGDGVVLLHEVTLGGTGKHAGDRHPKLGDHVMVGAGAKLLGNIRIGDRAKIGAGSVVLGDVPADTTVVGIPAKPIGSRQAVAASAPSGDGAKIIRGGSLIP